MYKEKREKGAVIGFIIALLLVLPAVLGVIFADDIKGWFDRTDKQPVENVESIGDVVAGVENSDLVKLTKRNKISANGNALSVTATLSPDYIIDKTVNWSLAWNGTNSGNVEDYINLSISDDTLTCSVSVKKAFTTQIKLTCTANSNSMARATCTIDYVDRNYSFGQNVDFVADMESKNPFDTSILEIVEDALNGAQWSDTNLYLTNGGTLRGAVKNIEFKEGFLNFDDVITFDTIQKLSDRNLGDVIVESIEQYTGSLTDSINSLKTLKSEFTIQADIYYGETLIAENVNYTIQFTIDNISTYYFGASDVTLNDTQLIF